MPLITVQMVSNPTILSDMEVYEDHNTEKVMNVDPMEVQALKVLSEKTKSPISNHFTEK